MASWNGRGRPSSSLKATCQVCGEAVQILNGDVQFSLDVHMQSHMSLDGYQRQDQLMDAIRSKVNSSCICPDCGENVEIVNNSVSASLHLHSYKYNCRSYRMYTPRSEDQCSNSSGKSKNSSGQSNSAKFKPHQSNQMSVLDGIFSSMQPGLQSHRGFVLDSDDNKAFCTVCKMKIDSIFSVTEHLKTKLHEDNSILFLRESLPPELREGMDFVSFYGSNLCCNLCRCKIDLCSYNPHKTIVIIMAHNAGTIHLSKKTKVEASPHSIDAAAILESLAHSNHLIKTNKHIIDCKMQPVFKCKMCDKFIAYNQMEKDLLKGFSDHLQSANHLKSVKAENVVESFKATEFPTNGKHDFVASKGQIICRICDTNVEVSIAQLVMHVKENHVNRPIGVASMPKNAAKETVPGTELRLILNALPYRFRNINYVIESNPGQLTCLICNCPIPATAHNLKDHLTGSKHMKNEQARDPSTDPVNQTVTSCTKIEEDVLLNKLKSDPVIKSHAKLMVKSNDHYSCKVCNTKIPRSYDEEILKNNILSHFLGQKHKLKIQECQNSLVKHLLTSDPVIKANEKFLNKQDDSLVCLLCDCKMTISSDEELSKLNCLSHLKGKQHVNKIEKLKQDLLGKASNTTHTLGKVGPTDEIKNLFKALPANFQNDISYMEKSSVEGYIFCNLCSAVINPHYLREHLIQLEHVQRKAVRVPQQPHMNPERGTESLQVKDNMGTLLSILGNIEKKMNWPIKQ